MTKKRINKSEMIRDYKKNHPKAGPAAISKALSTKNLLISEGFVSTVLSQAGLTDKSAPVHSRAAKTVREEIALTRADSDEPTVSKSDLFSVIDLSNQMGGIKALKDAIAIIEQLQELNVKL